MAQTERFKTLNCKNGSKQQKENVLCFFSIEGIVATIVLEKGQTVTSNFYKEVVLPKVFKSFKKNQKSQHCSKCHASP